MCQGIRGLREGVVKISFRIVLGVLHTRFDRNPLMFTHLVFFSTNRAIIGPFSLKFIFMKIYKLSLLYFSLVKVSLSPSRVFDLHLSRSLKVFHLC